MKYIIILILFVTNSCTPKPKTIKVVSSYKYGIEIAENSDNLIKNLIPIGDFCLKNNLNETGLLPLISSRANKNAHIRYNYNAEDLILWINKLNNCTNSSEIIYLNSIKSKITYFERMRHNGYVLNINIKANKSCNKKISEFSSMSKKSIAKFGKLISLGAISENKTQSLIATIIVYAYYDAISNIYSQIKKRC